MSIVSEHSLPNEECKRHASEDTIPRAWTISLLLASTSGFLFTLARDDLAQHNYTVPVHECHTRQALAILEGVAHQGLLRCEAALGHFVRFQRVRIVHLLTSGLLAHLPLELRDPARRSTTAHETNRRVAHLDFIGDVEDLNLGIELTRLPKCLVLLVHHDIAGAWHVVLVKTLDVQTDIVPRICKIDALVVHLDGEDFTRAGVRRSVCRQEDHLLTRLHNTLLDATSQDVAHTLDLVDSRDWHAHGCADWPLRHPAKLVEHVIEGVALDVLLAILDLHALPPSHVI